MKSKYEISIWSDVYDEALGRFVEQKEIVIGSNTMTSESCARNPKMVNNINGTNNFTFDLYYKYVDTRTGEEVENPYIKYLVNERKIKVLWKDEWYDLLIKQIKEDQKGHIFSYTCEDSYITELSRSGFELEFSTELENNIGTAEELIDKVIANTDWKFDKNGSDIIYQLTEEPVYEVTILNDFTAEQCPLGEEVTLEAGYPALVYYSCAADINSLKEKCQIYYSGTMSWQQDQNDMLVINGNCFNVTIDWEIQDEIAIAKVNGITAFELNFHDGVSNDYRAERYVQSQKTEYNNIVDRYVNVYNDGALYGFYTTEYNDALAVVNLITNPSNFKNTSGWIGIDLKWQISPKFDSTTVISQYKTISYLRLLMGQNYYNTGIQNNRSYISKGLIVGDKYIFRIRAKAYSGEPYYANYIKNPDVFEPSIERRNPGEYNPIGGDYFEITNSLYSDDDWLEYDMTCIKSCSYDMINSTSEPFGIFVKANETCWIEEIQFYREVWGSTGYGTEEKVRINPGQMEIQSVAQQVWKYFDANQPEGTTDKTLEYVFTSLNEWSEAEPVYNNYERYATIEESQSNRFNILQTIAENFECWIRFKIEHDETGHILTDDEGRLLKWIQIKREAGQETGIGFIYGVDLKDVTRTIKSNQISSKIIVQQNENEFGKNGFCSIARSEYNHPKENVIYNFDYYIQQGLLDRHTLYNDLYSSDGLNYFSNLHELNTEYEKNLNELINKRSEYTKQDAMATIYSQYITAALEEKASIEDSLKKLAGVDTMDAVYSYASTHWRDTKVQTLIEDRSQVEDMISMYQSLNESIQASLALLDEYITNTQARQDEIIEELRELNRLFYIKYSRFIQEGTWQSEDYWDDNKYYLDALQVAYQSSRPQISYDINVLRLSELDDYSSKVFRLGDISFIQDTKYFGYLSDGFTPYKEKVVLTEITSFFDTPDKDIIKVQNYKNQFDDLFHRITAATQSLEFSEGKYAKAASIVETDGTIKSSVIQNTFDSNKDLIYGAQNEAVTMDNTGITVSDNGDAAHLLKITSGGVFVSADGSETWKNAVRGDGINTELLTAGKINTEEITVYNGEFPSFRWDANGLNAYRFDSSGAVDTRQFVRFDQYGIYGLKNAPTVYIPENEGQIYKDANFGLTWNKFFMKSNIGNRSIEISTDRDIVVKSDDIERVVIGRVDGVNSNNYGIRVKNANKQVVFQCDNNGSLLCGWKLQDDYLQSRMTKTGGNISIFANGNIGCYGHEAVSTSGNVYKVTAKSNFEVTGLNTGDTVIGFNDEFYIFAEDVVLTSTFTIGGQDSDHGDKYHTPPSSAIPTLPGRIQLVLEPNKNYEVGGLSWDIELEDQYGDNNKGYTYNTTWTDEVIDKGGGETEIVTVYTTVYTYYFKLTATLNNNTLFIIRYTSELNDKQKNKYIPAADTAWSIDNEGNATFHNIYADGGKIAGWWIDDQSIYQTYDGTKERGENDSNVKTQLNSKGNVQVDDKYYTFITDAINAAMATIGGVSLANGLVCGRSIDEIYALAKQANSTAWSAWSKADKAYDHLPSHKHGISRDWASVGTDGKYLRAASETGSAGSQ